MIKKNLWIVFLFTLTVILSRTADAAVIVSHVKNCDGVTGKNVMISDSLFMADYSVKVSPDAIFPDITMHMVDNPRAADLILIDGYTDTNLKFCKVKTAFGMTKSVLVRETVFQPDISVKLTDYAGEYKLFVQSSSLTADEAAALFAVMWFEGKQKQIYY